MEQGVITKQELPKFLRSIKDAVVLAPVERERGLVFDRLAEDDSICFDYITVRESAKGIFFPQREVLCSFEDGNLKEVPLDGNNYVVFGLRPCDATAITFLDEVFSDQFSKFKDPYYLSRRENSVLITLTCNETADTCFCTTTGGDPAGTRGADILATDLGEKLLFEAVTDKGEELMKAYKGSFKKAEEADIKEREGLAEEARKQLTAIDIEGLKQKLDEEFDDEDWAKVTANCLGCGACTYLCPTCHCFDITDEKNKTGFGLRLRSWDSCQYPLFTKHASGHNPRVNKTQRMRQRIMHKFSYTIEKTDDIFCVGCGRCISNCPVNLDIRDILRTFAQKPIAQK
jgi:sulfhydrogenase subunit beta (sulfur reductase)